MSFIPFGVISSNHNARHFNCLPKYKQSDKFRINLKLHLIKGKLQKNRLSSGLRIYVSMLKCIETPLGWLHFPT